MKFSDLLDYGLSIVITTSFKSLLRLVISLMRLFDFRIGLVPKPTSIKPTNQFVITSTKSKSRNIEVHVYRPPSSEKQNHPLPVFVSFHGSGFTLPCFGVDAELCTHIAAKVGCIVVDADYAKGPEDPHPAAIDDALDVLAFVASKPDLFDLDRVAVGGYSAGGNVAMLAALSLPEGTAFSIKAIIAWYAPTDLTRAGKGKKVPWIMQRTHQASRQCYLPPGKDASDPRVSPLFGDSAKFPPTTLIVRTSHAQRI
jgi:acetyl esterase/lipase